jgi:predicted Zn-dependent protease
MSRPLSPDHLVDHAIECASGPGCVVLLDEARTANLRWAANTLTTNGQTRDRSMTVIAVTGDGPGASAGVLSRTVASRDDVAALVADAEAVAADSPPEQSAAALVAGTAAADFDEPPAESGIDVFTGLVTELADVLGAAEADGIAHYGFAEHVVTTTYLATSAGLRRRHVQPEGHLTVTAKDAASSAWEGRPTRDFTDVSVASLDADLRTRLSWSARRADLSPGRYRTVLPPSSVADLMIYAYWEMSALAAHDGRTVYADPGRGTKVGTAIADPRVSLFSDPDVPALQCSDVVLAHASSQVSSVFDNGVPSPATRWIDHGTLAALLQTRHSARLTGLPMTPAVDNLVLTVDGGHGSVADLAARVQDGILVTSLWYIREVDPQNLLLTGLTRDGVFRVSGGEVVGAVPNFRFNESPLDLLTRIVDAGDSVATFSREWGEFFSRTAMPPLTLDGFHLSTSSDAQ